MSSWNSWWVDVNRNLIILLNNINSISAADDDQSKNWTGKWFPKNPTDTTTPAVDLASTSDSWKGKWWDQSKNIHYLIIFISYQSFHFRFPHDPSSPDTNKDDDKIVSDPVMTSSPENDRIMGIPNKDCDDGEVSGMNEYDRETIIKNRYQFLDQSQHRFRSSRSCSFTAISLPREALFPRGYWTHSHRIRHPTGLYARAQVHERVHNLPRACTNARLSSSAVKLQLLTIILFSVSYN